MADSTALLTDHYELTMLEAALRSGAAHRWSVFEVFARSLPAGRRYGVVVGLDRVLDAIERFRFDEGQLSWLEGRGFLSTRTLDYLAAVRFTGDVDAYREGEAYFPGSPVLTVTAPFGEGVLLETVVLSILNHDSAVAAAAARMVQAAGDVPVVEMGARRTHEQAAVAAARAAAICGFAWSSDLEAGRRHGLKTAGTAAHAFTLVHDDERSAFQAQVDALGADTTLLVDTYDTREGIRLALEVAGPALGAVRVDSGDLVAEAHAARAQLDAAGATSTKVVVTGDLDEHVIAQLVQAPVDVLGVGTKVVVGAGAPTCGFVYKLVARTAGDDHSAPLVPVAKRSPGKRSVGGRKRAWRLLGPDGKATLEVLERSSAAPPSTDVRLLQIPALTDGMVVHRPSLEEVRAHHALSMAELPAIAFDLAPGEAALEVTLPEHSPEPQEAART